MQKDEGRVAGRDREEREERDERLEAAADTGSGSGEPSDIAGWAVAATLGTEQEATFAVGFLRNAGLPAEMESLVFHQEPVNFGGLGEVRVRVPEEHLEEARRLLAERETGAALPEDAAIEPESGEGDAAGGSPRS